MERAIKDLCQLSDTNLFKEIAVGIGHVMDAVNELDTATRKLHEIEHYYPARVLENLATEEAAKVLILGQAATTLPASLTLWPLSAVPLPFRLAAWRT